MMRILGIDPGLRHTGYGCVDLHESSTHPALVEAGVIRVPQRGPLGDRLASLHDDLDALIEQMAPGLVVVETVFAHRNRAQTAMQMGHARGVILLAAARRSIPLDELAPATIKRAVAGHGRADKTQVQHAVAAQLGLSEPPSSADAADALAIALAAAFRSNSPVIGD